MAATDRTPTDDDHRRGGDPSDAHSPSRLDRGSWGAEVGHAKINRGHPRGTYIGRAAPRLGLPASPLHNPYRIGDPHDSLPRGDRLTRERVLLLYEDYLRRRPFLMRKLPDLRGRVLLCWCRAIGNEPTPENACHGDVLIRLLETFSDEQLREMR